MKYCKLQDLCTNIIDCPHSTPEWKDSGIRVVRNFNLKNGNLDFTDGYFVDEETYLNRIKRAVPEEYDIVISREAPMGVVAIIPKNLKCCLGQRLVLLKVDKNKVNPVYLLYVLMSDFAQTQFRRADATGSIVSNLCIPDLKDIIIPLIEENQDDVSNLLANINDKLLLNNKINDNLQQQLKLMYDYWFTQFDFPDENGKPYKSSGGKMVWNVQLKRDIPVGWQVKPLSQIIKKNVEAIQPAIDLSVMPSNSIALSEINTSDNFTTNLFKMKKGDILFGSIRPYLHKAGFAPCDGVVAGTVHSYRAIDKHDSNFALFTISCDAFFDYAVNVSSGTKMPVVSSDSILDYQVPYNSDIAKRFGEHSIIETISSNIQESQRLISLRDWLLPMLMNGQATISD